MIGLTGRAKRYEQFSLSDLMIDERWLPTVGPPELVNALVGPDRTLACLEFGILLVSGDLPKTGKTLTVRYLASVLEGQRS